MGIIHESIYEKSLVGCHMFGRSEIKHRNSAWCFASQCKACWALMLPIELGLHVKMTLYSYSLGVLSSTKKQSNAILSLCSDRCIMVLRSTNTNRSSELLLNLVNIISDLCCFSSLAQKGPHSAFWVLVCISPWQKSQIFNALNF